MNRNQFIKLTGFTGIALAAFPQLAFQNTYISHEELIGKGNPPLFGEGFKLRKEAYDAFNNMKNEALKSDISIKVVSSYRDFNHQNTIWERKYKRYRTQGLSAEQTIEKIIEYSTIPGTSRHHWGTDIDIVDANAKQPSNLLDPINFEANASFGKLKQWLDIHVNSFGFYLVYTNESMRKGFKYEPWHYSYKPLSQQFLSEYKKLDLVELLKREKFMGSPHFSEEFISKYLTENLLDINPELL